MSSNILTFKEALDCLDLDDDSNISGIDDMLTSVDAYITNATGYTWQSGTEISPTAKAVARVLLKVEYEGTCDELTQKRITARLMQLRNLVNEKG